MTELMTDRGMVRVPAGMWRIDPSHSSAAFAVKHMMIATVRGRFREFAGGLLADPDDPARSRAWGTAKVASIDTGDPDRDAHLRSPDFFDVDRHPELRFRSTAIQPSSHGSPRVHGELTAAGNRVALELEPTVEQTDGELHVDARTTIDQRQLGITWSPLGMTRAPVTVHVHAVLRPER